MIIIRLDRMLADRKMQLSKLAELVDISVVNLSNLKTGKVKAQMVQAQYLGHKKALQKKWSNN